MIEVMRDVAVHFRANERDYDFEKFRDIINDFEKLWQSSYGFGAIYGCHIPIKCPPPLPPRGQESAKVYCNFKNFYTIVLMAIADSKYRFIWANCGIPGNSHDSAIFQPSELYRQITENIIPNTGNTEDGQVTTPLLVRDSAFPFRTWLLKPFTSAMLTPEERYFNYCLSRALTVTEGAYGKLKGR